MPPALIGEASPAPWLRPAIALAAVGAVFLGWWIVVAATGAGGQGKLSAVAAPVDGLTIFAVFFVAAAAVERLLEPVAGLLPDRSDLLKAFEDKKIEAGTALLAGATDVEARLTEAARQRVHADDWVFGQTAGFWALATIVGIVTSAVLELYLPHAVGVASGGRPVQILATGLIIGGGTKPLHDLIGYLTAAKEKKETTK